MWTGYECNNGHQQRNPSDSSTIKVMQQLDPLIYHAPTTPLKQDAHPTE
jgi:hypothetical protein